MIIALQTLIYFRESIIRALQLLIRPYYKRLALTFSRNGTVSDDEDSDDQVFAEYDDEKGVIFFPPMYIQRYAAVSDCLMDERWCGQLEKVVDLGYNDMSFIKYLKDVPGIKHILGVDLEAIPLRCSSDLLSYNDYTPKRETPLHITLFQGNAADPDYRLIGCDAVVSIEMIEHMLPQDLERLVHTVFGFIKPRIAVFTTPNGDFNVLFKSLEKNGFRRLDHFFEWSREQFNDWCSNTVERYPQYTVSSRGIGPGPSGTNHIGCCSQLALFVSKDYQKQPDLNLNSLMVVANAPNPQSLDEFSNEWDIVDNIDNNCIPNTANNSLTNLIYSEMPSNTTLTLSNSTKSVSNLEYVDKTSQCNLDNEWGKDFMMFDAEQLYKVMKPSRKIKNKMYDIEDVTRRLNCSTLEVTKFSKTTKNLMAKNRMDHFAHTRQVVSEIKHLTKMLNFNKDKLNQHTGNTTWRNINWGDDAPYWNQYYKIIKEYKYPFEVKSEESRILDLISEEVNRLLDSHYEGDFYVDANKLEIPMEHLMKTVHHITEDVTRVVDILEWNGYDVVNNVLIHTRLALDDNSTAYEDDWQETDTLSEWDTDFVSTTASDATPGAPDSNGLSLRRALDRKLKKLRTMTANEDLASELDRVVCRLMKLALRTTKRHQYPPPAKWLQCKLLDILSLTEKAIEKRRNHFISSYPLKTSDNGRQMTLALTKIQEDDTATKIVEKYQHLLLPTENSVDSKDVLQDFLNTDIDTKDDLSTTSNEFLKDNEYLLHQYEDFITNQCLFESILPFDKSFTTDRTKSWIEEGIEIVQYPEPEINSGDTESSGKDLRTLKKHSKKLSSRTKMSEDSVEGHKKPCSKKHSDKSKRKTDVKYKNNYSNPTKVIKKVVNKRSSYHFIQKSNAISPFDYPQTRTKIRYQLKDHYNLQSTEPNPIPGSIIELCSLQNIEKDISDTILGSEHERLPESFTEAHLESVVDTVDFAVTEKSFLIDIVMDGGEETIAMRRTIGTDAETFRRLDELTELGSLVNLTNADNFHINDIITRNFELQTYFLNDINEPSTSKGVRHINMDAQCGPDSTLNIYPVVNAATSESELPKLYINSKAIKIGDSLDFIRVDIKRNDFGTLTEDCIDNSKVQFQLVEPTGINITDLDCGTHTKVECSTTTQGDGIKTHVYVCNTLIPAVDIKEINPGATLPDDFNSKFVDSNNLRVSDFNIKEDNNVMQDMFSQKYKQPKLSHGGIHCHSFKENNACEDVIYQGGWQKNKLNRTEKKTINLSSSNKFRDATSMKKNILKEECAVKTQIHGNKECSNPHRTTKKNVKFSIRVNQGSTHTSEATQSMNNTPATPLIKPITANSRKKLGVVPSKLAVRTPSLKMLKCVCKISPSSSDLRKAKRNEITKGLPLRYLPRYLRKRRLENKVLKNKSESEETKDCTSKAILTNSALSKDLLSFQVPSTDITYVVFRNELEVNDKKNKSGPVVPESSPLSHNSSTCSSRDSVATVRVSSQKSHTNSNEFNNSLSGKSMDKIVKKPMRIPTTPQKTSKRDKIDTNNKENIPNTSYYRYAPEKLVGTFAGSNKKVFMAQVSDPTAVKNISKLHAQSSIKSNIKIPSASSPRIKSKSTSPVFSKKQSLKSMKSVTDENCRTDNIFMLKSHISNLTETKKSNSILDNIDSVTTRFSNSFSSNDKVNKEHITYVGKMNDNYMSNTAVHMRKIIDETLDCINYQSSNFSEIDSRTIILSSEESIEDKFFDDSFSPISYKSTSFVDFDPVKMQDSLNTILEDSMFHNESTSDNNSGVTTSHKSVLSAKVSLMARISENGLESVDTPHWQSPKETSVHGLFEGMILHNQAQSVGAVAQQAFSGFSVNVESAIGDRPDYVNLIDSETGSMAVEISRQTTSEELFVSGRSSNSIESCVIEDPDIVVPNWLFSLISHQQSVNEHESEDTLPIQVPLQEPIPIAEPVYDVNGNVEPGVGAISGAGDGRGIHSDQSQASSGQGTSLSTSDTSSGQLSEAVLPDPSTLNTQYTMLREPLEVQGVSVTLNVRSESSLRTPDVDGDSEYMSASSSRHNRSRALSNQLVSDGDADISSLDTDAADQDDLSDM